MTLILSTFVSVALTGELTQCNLATPGKPSALSYGQKKLDRYPDAAMGFGLPMQCQISPLRGSGNRTG